MLDTVEESDTERIRSSVREIVRHCVNVSYSGDHRSLEEQLREIPDGREISGGKGVAQVDKLARYFGLSKDLAKLARTAKYHHVMQNVSLQVFEGYPSIKPIGASSECHVHAEVQLILYYEQHTMERPPRAIGCSKSACFLCHSLIQKLGRYCISHSHGHLYHKWTISDVTFMTTERVKEFRSVLEKMCTEMASLRRVAIFDAAHGRSPLKIPFDVESRAIAPLSSPSTAQSTLADHPLPCGIWRSLLNYFCCIYGESAQLLSDSD
ncbi:hypothetical protein F5Y06DRAFT_305549 [Hypoxylon sp. FL0890]|nr:hypothetical protein F5Y06DRAFT_305549 [Hypoxylon sp. FL0890]